MKTPLKTLRNFLVANLFALVPLWYVAFGWMPDQVKVYVRGGSVNSVSIVAGEVAMLGEDYGPWLGGEIWRFYLREGMEWKNLAFRLPRDADANAVDRIELQKWKLFSFGKTGMDLEKAESGNNDYRYPDPHFDRFGFASRKIGWGILGLEGLLLVLSWLFARRHREESWRTLLPSVLGVSLALTLLIQVVLPIQSYIANQSTFPFTLSALCADVAIRFVLLFVWDTLAVFLLARCFGRWVLAPVFAFTICAYLESGVLTEGQPELNGDWSFFTDPVRARWDAAVWGGVFILVFAVHRWMKKWYGVAGLCAIVMLAASMLDVKHEQKADTSGLLVHDFTSIGNVIRSVTFSTNRNVLVFVIDSLEREQAHAIMEDQEAGPELREKFCGFTEYIDNVGAWNTSLTSVAQMLTGTMPSDASHLADYFVSPYSADSVLADYRDAGSDVYLATEALGFGWSSRHVGSKQETAEGCVLSRRTDGELGWNILNSARFRWWPFAGKHFLAALTGLSIAKEEDWSDETTVFSTLKIAETGENPAGSFVFLHTRGVHSPVVYARDGTLVFEIGDNETACVEAGIWILRQLGGLFDVLREEGCFDQSLILVVADHGNHAHGEAGTETLPANGRPFLWVKAQGSVHAFSTSDAPVYSGRIADLLRLASRGTPTEKEVTTCLSASEREYRVMSEFGGNVQVWKVSESGACGYREETLVVGMLAPLEIGVDYSLENNALGGRRGCIAFSGVGFWPAPVLLPGHPSMGIEFRVSDSQKRYRLHLSTKMTRAQNGPEDPAGASLILEQCGAECAMTEILADYQSKAVLSGLQPDADGKVVIAGRRANGLNANVFFQELRLEEE